MHHNLLKWLCIIWLYTIDDHESGTPGRHQWVQSFPSCPRWPSGRSTLISVTWAILTFEFLNTPNVILISLASVPRVKFSAYGRFTMGRFAGQILRLWYGEKVTKIGNPSYTTVSKYFRTAVRAFQYVYEGGRPNWGKSEQNLACKCWGKWEGSSVVEHLAAPPVTMMGNWEESYTTCTRDVADAFHAPNTYVHNKQAYCGNCTF